MGPHILLPLRIKLKKLSLSLSVSRLFDPGTDHLGDHCSVCHPLLSQESLQGRGTSYTEGEIIFLVSFLVK